MTSYNITILKGIFQDHNAKIGGSIYVFDTINMIIDNIKINNSTGVQGGGISVQVSKNVDLKNI